jgi:hypothetical protein
MAVLHSVAGSPHRYGARVQRKIGNAIFSIEKLPSFLGGMSLLTEAVQA